MNDILKEIEAEGKKRGKVKARINADDFAYVSAYLRAHESKLLKRSDIIRLAGAPDMDSAKKQLSQMGITPVYNSLGDFDIEASVKGYLSSAYDGIKSALGEEWKMFEFMFYQYDCHNIKSAVKCCFKGEDAHELYIDFGTVSLFEIDRMMQSRDFSHLPQNMAGAAPLAISAYEKTRDPQIIDRELDLACYRDMLDLARSVKCKFFENYVVCKIDVTNILLCERLKRMKQSDAEKSFDLYFIEGGRLGKSVFSLAFNGKEKDFAKEISEKGYKSLASSLDDRLSVLEKNADILCLALAGDSKNSLCGADVVCAYIIARENDAKNLRIVLASIGAGLDGDEITNRLRLI